MVSQNAVSVRLAIFLFRRGAFFRFREQGAQRVHRKSQRAAGKSVDVSGVHADDFGVRVEYGTTAATVGGGSVIDQLVSYYIAEVSAGGRRTN